MELDSSKVMLDGLRRDGWGTIGGGRPRPLSPLGYAPEYR